MHRLIVAIVNEGRWHPSNHREVLLNVKSRLSGLKVRLIDVRIGSERIEVDLFVDRGESEKVIHNISTMGAIAYVKEVGREETKDERETIKQGIEFFNEERFWEAHEALEGVWRRKEGRIKAALSGVILAAAAYVNLQKGKDEQFFSIMYRALQRLDECALDRYMGIDIARLKAEIAELIKRGERKIIKLRHEYNS